MFDPRRFAPLPFTKIIFEFYTKTFEDYETKKASPDKLKLKIVCILSSNYKICDLRDFNEFCQQFEKLN